jgi:hypothetical protein
MSPQSTSGLSVFSLCMFMNMQELMHFVHVYTYVADIDVCDVCGPILYHDCTIN